MNDTLGYMIEGVVLVSLLAVFAWTLVFCFIDARRRGKSPLLVTLLVFLSFPLGLIAWLLFRPEPSQGGGAGFRLTDHRVQ